MRKAKKFLLNGALLALTTLAMRFVSVAFNVYLSDRLGPPGMGLLTLTLSVYGFGVTFATSGVNLASTRLVAEAIGRGSEREIRKAVSKCVLYSLAFGLCAGIIMYSASSFIGNRLLNDGRTIPSLRLLAVSLPAVSLTSALSGYFSAVRRVWKSASAMVFSQAVKIGATAAALSMVLPFGIEYSCAAVVGGATLSELASLLWMFIAWRVDYARHNRNGGEVLPGVGKRLLSNAMPVAIASYARSGLITIEHILIPRGLLKSGISYESALASYATVHAMALPIVLFPSAILSSFASLLVPELSEALAAKDTEAVNRTADKVMRTTAVFASGTAGILAAFGRQIGETVYSSAEAGKYISLFALLIPIMYFDTATDAMLKGIGEQVYSMRVNILDAAVSVLLVWILIPKMGISGYIIMVFVTELLNTVLSVKRLFQRIKTRPGVIRNFISPLVCSIGAASLSNLVFSFMPVYIEPKPLLVLMIALACTAYMLMLLGTGCITLSQLKKFKGMLTK